MTRRYQSRRALSGREAKMRRECLKCGGAFIAKGRYNRICPKCAETNRAYALTATYTTYSFL